MGTHYIISKYSHYNPGNQGYAKSLRKNMTKAEACLWKFALKGGKMRGYTFYRQRPVLNYIVDFICRKLKLIIEVDGISHHFNETGEKDVKKQKALEDAGNKVIRVSDSDILRNIKGVISILEAVIEERVKELSGNNSVPPPFPPPAEGDNTIPN